jgi:8-amino-7-oxononanoate synthase
MTGREAGSGVLTAIHRSDIPRRCRPLAGRWRRRSCRPMGHEPPPTYDDMRRSLRTELEALSEAGRLRQRPVIDSPDDRVIVLCDQGRRRKLHNWASNDYLGAANRLRVKNAAARALRSYGAGAGAARLLAGGLRCHRRLEERLAHWLGCEEVLVTTTGFQANLAVLFSLASGAEDVVILDRLCHASTYDGARLATASMARFQHNDVADLEKQLVRTTGAHRRVVCVESVYSMDGDEAPLAAIQALCRRHGALLVVDEAHAIGVVGPGGRGLCAELGVVPDVRIGTCSKSLGSQGGFIAGDREVVELVVNRGRSFIFSTAPVPAAMGAAVATLDVLRDEPDLPARLVAEAGEVRAALQAQGWSVPEGRSPIIPVIIGDEQPALALAGALRAAGHYAPAIRPPTVQAGSCRLRLTVTLAHTRADRRRLIKAMAGLKAPALT